MSEHPAKTKRTGTVHIAKSGGTLLALISLIFVGNAIWGQREFLSSINMEMMSAILVVGIPFYFFADLILAAAWKMLLNWFGEYHLVFFKSIWIYGKSQILKYIPGNLLYLPGRHVIGSQHGADHASLAGAATFEIIGLFASASCISILGVAFFEGINARSSLPLAVGILLLSLASPILLKFILSIGFVAKRMPILEELTWGGYFRLIGIWLLYASFFAIVGLILFWTTIIITGRWSTAMFYASLFTFTISWLLGTITPGAPAGAGIREGIIILIMSPYIGEPNSVLVSLIMRIITMLGDATFYFLSLYLERKFP